jgi:DmsE family decaheme c-type cytochrome
MRHPQLAGWLVVAAGLVLAAGCARGDRSGATSGREEAAPAQRAEYAGSHTCVTCHAPSVPAYEQTVMGKVFMHNARTALERQNCEACHGPGGDHVIGGGGRGKGVGPGQMITFAKDDPTPVDQRNAKCLACHERRAHLYWKGSTHDRNDVACTNCHTIMQRQSPKAQLARSNVVETCAQCHIVKRDQVTRVAHMPIPEGKMSCTDCHNPHGSSTPFMLVRESPNATCYTCHADKRGPYLWEHPPVQETCMNCHNPHGSNHQHMLKTMNFRLCQQCHIETRHPTSPYSAGSRFVFNRACLNCHSRIHGSNHPSGFAFEN